MSAVAVLAHRVRELRDPVAGRSQPLLNLGEVEDHLPVGSGVQGRRLLGPESRRTDLQRTSTAHCCYCQAESVKWTVSVWPLVFHPLLKWNIEVHVEMTSQTPGVKKKVSF